MPPCPTIAPASANDSYSMGGRAGRPWRYAPSGPPTWMARIGRPDCESRRQSRFDELAERDAEARVSTIPPRAMLPASWNTWVPSDRSRPRRRTHRLHRPSRAARAPSVSTLLTTVGLPKSPSSAGNGGLARTCRACLRDCRASTSLRHRCRHLRPRARAGRTRDRCRGRCRRASRARRAISMAELRVATASGYSDRK